jgi:hypothetical protein
MIEFRLQIDSRITRAVVPLIVKSFSECGKSSEPVFPYPEESDEELMDAWNKSLREDLAQDRQRLARLLNDAKFAHGYVEVPEDDMELVLRALTEIRLFIRKSNLDAFSDEELETGEFILPQKPQLAQSYYLAYLVLAEVQEGLISQTA